ncbi:MAG: hypothetical protein R3D05_19265 [Dongiaceae bacterium]
MSQIGLSEEDAETIARGEGQKLVDELVGLRDEAQLEHHWTTARQYEERRRLIIAAMRVGF